MLETDPLDILLDSTGDIVIDPVTGLQFVSGAQGVAQLIRIGILTFLGEWFLNQSVGVDWFGYILGENYDERTARAALTAIILASPGVDSIESLTITRDTVARDVSIAFTVMCSFGDTASDSLSLSQVMNAPPSGG